MEWLDRISGKRVQAAGGPFAPGQWQYYGQQRLSIRDTVALPGDVLMPGPDGRCNAPKLGPIRCDAHLIPDDDALRSLRLMGDRLRTLETKPWADWIAETPLLPALDDALDETPLERTINNKDFECIKTVFKQPRTDLSIEEKRLVIARCKRLSTRAPIVLAAHSEDWESRTLWGVRPKRILGIVYEEIYDIYENRLAVVLVNNIDVVLLCRLRAVRRVVELLRQHENYQHLLEDSQNYLRAYRILEMWGDALGDKDQLKYAESVQSKIIKLRRKVIALKDTLLYRQIGGRWQGRQQLRMTNILSHDTNYRHVAELWIEWENHLRSLSVDPDIRWRQEQEAADGFDRFLFLVIVRALDVLGYSPTAGAQGVTIGYDGKWILDGPVGQIVLRRDSSGTSVHSMYAEQAMKFVSLPAMLEASFTVDNWFSSLDEVSVVIVALPADEPRAPAEVRMRLRSFSDGHRSAPMFVAVAPWDLESVERMARILRYYAWSALFGRYPLAIELPGGWAPPVTVPHPHWLRIVDRTLYVIKPPALHERTWAELDERINVATNSLKNIRAKLDACAQHENRKRLHLKRELEPATVERDKDRKVVAEIETALSTVELLRSCPVCQILSDIHDFEKTDDLFRSQCSECGAAWGRRTCSACQKPFPFLDFPGNIPSEDILEADRRYGADVLAIPLSDQVYLCPNCSNPTDSILLNSDHC